MAEGAPDSAARDYIYRAYAKSSTALAGLGKSLAAAARTLVGVGDLAEHGERVA